MMVLLMNVTHLQLKPAFESLLLLVALLACLLLIVAAHLVLNLMLELCKSRSSDPWSPYIHSLNVTGDLLFL